jgi:hypothetical protein
MFWQRWRRWGIGGHWVALVLSLPTSGCDGGRQLVGWETTDGGLGQGDTYLPWYGGSPYYKRWTYPPVTGPDSWIVSVWMQNPINAARFRDAGINLFAGLWNGPTDDQMATLARASMPVIAHQSGVWKAYTSSATPRGWLLPDQPDNAQPLSNGGFGPCIPPDEALATYRATTQNDASRPAFLALGRGIVEPDWVGRGAECTGHPEHYADYARAADMLGVVIYPLDFGLPIETVAAGVERARTVSGDEKPVIALVQASRIGEQRRPTPAQIRAHVWMSIVHRAAGIQYYCHQQRPTVVETDCIDDAATLAALRAINTQLSDLAPVLDTLPVANGVTVSSSDAAIPVDTLLKRHAGATYLFATAMRGGSTRATFHLQRFPAMANAEVLGEDRSISVANGAFEDDFASYGVHLYRLTY